MADLPLGWEWDYDGSRWLYRYKPTGHVQYHFPKAGDEFPDYVDASAPALNLAPEERLESQQQIRRQGSTSDGTAGSQEKKKRAKKKDKDDWKTRMSATAQPVSTVWNDDFAADEDDEEGEGDGVFQPESFMFLGPGTYTDVSPLIDDEEEAAKRTVVGEQKDRTGPNNKSVSPVASENTTPMMQKSEVATGVQGATIVVMGECVIEAPPVILEEPVITQIESAGPVVPQPPPIMGDAVIIDGGYEVYELPVEKAAPMQRFDPVGVVAEMPTEQMAPARIETHPDPVEMADNSILAPGETAVPPGIAELPGRTSPVEQKVSGDEALREKQRQEQERKQSEPKAQPQQQQRYQAAPRVMGKAPDEPQMPVKIVRKPMIDNVNPGVGPGTSVGHGAYRPYVPGQAAPSTSWATDSFASRIGSTFLQREASLMMSMRQTDAPITIYPKLIPASLLPPRAPAKSSQNIGERTPSKEDSASGTLPLPTQRKEESEAQERAQGLSCVPSVLKPARNGPHRNSIQGQSPPFLAPDAQGLTAQGQMAPQQHASPGVSKFPSVLRPARGKRGQEPNQQPLPVAPNQSPAPEPAPRSGAPRRDSQGHGSASVPHGHRLPSMPLAPVQRPHTTAPDQPPARHQQPFHSQFHVAPQQAAPPVAQANVAPRLPYPTDPLENRRPVHARHFTALYPCDDALPSPGASTYGPSQIQQPARPASAMPVLGYERQGSGSVARSPPPGPAQQFQQRRQSYQPVGSQQQFSQMQIPKLPRPQSVMANPSSYSAVSANFVSYPNQSTQAQVIRRSTFTPDEISPIRPRSESQPSVFTPSPMEQSRRGSSNPSISRAVNGSYFTDLQTSGSQGRDVAPPPASQPSPPTTLPLRVAGQGPQVPDKIPLPRHEGSYLPPENFGSLASVATAGQNKNVSKRHSMPAHQPASMMQQNPPGQTSPTPNFQSSGAVEQRPGDLQRSQSLRQPSSRQTSDPLDNQGTQQQGPQQPLQGIGSSRARGHLLGSIEEHETETASGSSSTSNASGVQDLIPLPLFSKSSSSSNKTAGSPTMAWARKSAVDYSGDDWGNEFE